MKDEHGQEHTVIAWIWARTVKCPNPACGCEMPLASSFELSKKKGKEVYVQPIINEKSIRFEVKKGKNAPEPPKTARGAKFRCIRCGEATTPEYIKYEAKAGRMSAELMAIVTEGSNGRLYLAPDSIHIEAADIDKPDEYPTGNLSEDRRAVTCPNYGIDTFDKMFTNRQLVMLTNISTSISEAVNEVRSDGGTPDYANAVGVYLAFFVDKMTDYHSALCAWHNSKEHISHVFKRNALPMVWDICEANPFSNSSGCWDNMLNQIVEAICGSHNLAKLCMIWRNLYDLAKH